MRESEAISIVSLETARALVEQPETVGINDASVTPFATKEGFLSRVLPETAMVSGIEASTGRSVNVEVTLPGMFGRGVARLRRRPAMATEDITYWNPSDD